jgi:hypothetical protein
MGTKTIRVCDGCGKELKMTQEIYRLRLETDKFWNVVEKDWLEKNLDFCEGCATDIKDSLRVIAAKLPSTTKDRVEDDPTPSTDLK